jgi:hypothetical protein
MARIAGIQFNKTSNGTIKSVTIDLKKHGEVINPVLESLGVIDNNNFEQLWKQGMSKKEVRTKLFKTIDALPWKK